MHLRMELGCLFIYAPIASFEQALLVTFPAPGAWARRPGKDQTTVRKGRFASDRFRMS